MIRSMTGFGRAKAESTHYEVAIEMKSVNHRFCEINVRIPRQFLRFEDTIKKLLMKYIQRGKVEVFLSIEGEGLIKRELQVDWDLLDEYVKVAKAMKDRYSLTQSISIGELLQLQDAFHTREFEEESSELGELIQQVTEVAVLALVDMRQQEGAVLRMDLEEQLLLITEAMKQTKHFSTYVEQDYKDRLHKRVTEFTNGIVDEARLLTEIAILVEKADINEELKRLESHLGQFYHTLQLEESIGRKLDFLVQEMNREVNTIGSKANDSRIASMVVQMKSSLEKIKEQVQNIE